MAALAPAMFLAAFGISLATVALPTLARTFSATVGEVQWIVLAYLLSATVTVVLAGRLGDLIGPRAVLLAGIAIFAAASGLCAVAPSLGALVAARAAQGVGGAILMALPISLARATVAEARTGAAMGLFGTMSAIGTALGPSLGGIVIAAFGWRAAFVMVAIVAGALFIAAVRLVPATPTRRREGGLGLASAVPLAVALAAYALLAAGGNAGVPFGPWPLALVAAASLALFLAIDGRAADPLVPIATVRETAIGAALALNVLVATVMMATLVIGPFFLAFALGLDEALVGLVMAVGPVTAALAGVPAGRVTDRFGAPRVLAAGLCVILAGLVGFALLPRVVGVAGYIAALILLTPGFQLFLAANNTATMLAAPADRRGTVSGLLALSRNLGFMTGASAMGALFAAALGGLAAPAAGPQDVGAAFSVTFLAAAGLVAIALAAMGVSLTRRSAMKALRGGADGG